MPVTTKLIDSDRLVISFTGATGKMGASPEVFLKAAGLEDASHVVVYDTNRLMTFTGVPPNHATFEELDDELQDIVQRHPHRELITIGTSGGGLPALIRGHLLKADQTVVFACYPYIQSRPGDPPDDKLIATANKYISQHQDIAEQLWPYLDSRRFLSEWNGKTQYHVHVSRYHKEDYRRACLLKGLEGVHIHGHPYAEHGLASMLVKNGRLRDCFRFPYTMKWTVKDRLRLLRMKIRKLKGRKL